MAHLALVHRNPQIFVDPLGVENVNPPPPFIRASMTARVWTALSYSTVGGVGGAAVGLVISKFLFNSDSEEPEERSLSSWVSDPGAWIGGLVGLAAGAAYSLYRDHYVHFQLRTDFVGENKSVRQIALDKANTIFKAYISQKFGTNTNALCDNILSCNLYV